MLTIILVIAGLAVLILGHEAGHFLAAKAFGMKVDEFGVGFPPRVFARKKGGTEYSLNWLPFGGFVKIAGEVDRLAGETEKLEALPPEEKKKLFFNQPAWKRSVVMLSGVLANFLIGWLLFALVFSVGTGAALTIGGVQKDSPAAGAGILPGDVIQGYAGTAEFISFVNSHRGEQIDFQVKRDGEIMDFKMTPRVNTGPEEGAIGVIFAGIESRPILQAARDGLSATWGMTVATLEVVGQLGRSLIHGQLLAGVVGPVGIFSIAEETSRAGLIYLLNLLAIISVNLVVLNILPLPALDGGRFVLVLIEKIKGSPLPHKVEAWINGLGFAFLVTLMILLTIRDVVHL